MNRLLLGTLLGALLAGLRVPLEADLLQWPVVEATSAYRLRAAGWLIVAAAIGCSGSILDGRSRSAWLLGGFLGVSLETLAGRIGPDSSSAAWPLVPIALVLLIVHSRAGREPTQASDPPAAPPRLGPMPAAFIGAGLAFGLEGNARVLRRLGGGIDLDLGVFAAALALCMLVGGLSFAALITPNPSGSPRRRAPILTGLLAGPACVVSLMAIGSISTPRGLRSYLDRFHLDASLFGQLPYDLLLGALVFVLPAFVLGALLQGVRSRTCLVSLCIGAAAGLIGIPDILSHPPDASPGLDINSLPHSSQLTLWALGSFGLAGLAWCWRARRVGEDRTGWLVPAASLVLLTAPAIVPVQLLRVLPAWERFPRPFAEIFDTPEGQLSIHPSAPGIERVALDNRDLTPGRDRAGVDARRLRTSLALIEPAARERGARVLFIGQLTPGRGLVFKDEGIDHVDRSAAWWPNMPWLEKRLFGDRDHLLPPNGQILSPAEARTLVGAGHYDLVIALARDGQAPVIPQLDLPPQTRAVAWLVEGSSVAQLALPGTVLAVSDGLAHLSIGIVWGASLEAKPMPGQPCALLAGPPTPGPLRWTWMFERAEDRRRYNLQALAERLRTANADNDFRFLTAGLAAHFAIQERSSPWDDRAKKTEVSDDALAYFSEALSVGEPDALTREIWDGIAHVLVGKRHIEAIDTWIRPAAQMWPTWPALERAIALADLESLEHFDAIQRLEQLTAQFPDDFEAVRLLGKAHEQAGQPDQAATVWERLLARQGSNVRTRRKLAMAWVAAGEFDRARPLLRDLLKANPEDRELWGLLNPSPAGEPDQGFDPSR